MRNKIKILTENQIMEANAITHPAPHHADEVFATAILLHLGGDVKLVRTRNQDIIDNHSLGKIIYDVGGKYDEVATLFDHHQKDFNEVRADGTKFAAAGLIWRCYGEEVVCNILKDAEISGEIIKAIVKRVDELLIAGIDAHDNGQMKPSRGQMSVSSIISLFNKNWDESEDEDEDAGFLKACEIANEILVREVQTAASNILGKEVIKELIEANRSDSNILVMPKFIGGWIETVLESDSPNAKNLLFGAFPSTSEAWNIQSIPLSSEQSYQQRQAFPEQWRGLSDEQLARVSGIKTAKFCHSAGFFAVAGTKDDALKMANMAAMSYVRKKFWQNRLEALTNIITEAFERDSDIDEFWERNLYKKMILVNQPNQFNDFYLKEVMMLWMAIKTWNPESNDFLQNYNMILDWFYNHPRECLEKDEIFQRWLDVYHSHAKKMNKDWRQFNFCNRTKSAERDKKFYISIDNKDLHRFAKTIIHLAIEDKFYDLNFKINANQNFNRRDNAVIYTTTANYFKNLSLIKRALEMMPDITINESGLLWIPCLDQICFGVDDRTSFTMMIIKEIGRRLLAGHAPRDIASSIVKYQRRYGGGDHIRLEYCVRGNEDGFVDMDRLMNL